MASLDRAYGTRGAAIALTMAVTAGAVHGTFAHVFDLLWAKILVGMSGSIILVIAGLISARRSWWGATTLALLMGVLFFLGRWTCWAIMDGGVSEASEFLTTAPYLWPGYLAAAGISAFWRLEAISMCIPAMFGCYVGHEHGEAP